MISGPSVEKIKILLFVANQNIFLFLYCQYADATGRKFVAISKFLRWIRMPAQLWIFIDDIKYYGRRPCFYYGFMVIDLTMNTFYWVRPNYCSFSFVLLFFFCCGFVLRCLTFFPLEWKLIIIIFFFIYIQIIGITVGLAYIFKSYFVWLPLIFYNN